MRVRPELRIATLTGIACIVACSDAVPPYGFGSIREQSFRLEAQDRIDIDGSEVRARRYAEFRLVLQPTEKGTLELSLYLDRYYSEVTGAPGGRSEVAISASGVIARGGELGEVSLGPDDPGPAGRSLRTLLSRPLAGCIIDAAGNVEAKPWHSLDPLFAEIAPLEWILLGFPVLPTGGAASWSGRRELPRIGRYRMGVEIPLFYQRAVGSTGAGTEPARGSSIRVTGTAKRASLRLAPDFEGSLQLEHRGEIELQPAGNVAGAAFELSVRFSTSSGSVISSLHRVKIACSDCASGVNLPVRPPDME